MMTLEEAIIHCQEKSCGNSECALEHKQLAEWLKELKELRSKNYPKLTFIDTLEVKEVDLEEEVERFAKECGYKSAATIDFQFAKHFFELGLNASNPLTLEDSIKETLAQKYIDYTFKRHKIDPDSREGQLIYYAYMHGMNQCLDQLKTQQL